MKKNHGAFYNINLILIINLLERKQILKLIANIKSGDNKDAIEEKKNVCDSEVQTDNYHHDANDNQSITEDAKVLLDSGLPAPKPFMLSIPTNPPINNQIEDIRRFLGQFSDSEQLLRTAEAMDISNSVEENLTNQNSFQIEVPTDIELEEAIPMLTPKSKKQKIKREFIESYPNIDPIEVMLDDEIEVPSDIELEEAIPISTPKNKKKKIKREFIEPNPNMDPIEVMLDDEEDFNILDMTNEDFILTAGGPRPIKDYSSFVPGSVIPPSYDPSQSISQPFLIDSIDCNQLQNLPIQVVETAPSDAFNNTPGFKAGEDQIKSIQHILQPENISNEKEENVIEKKTNKDYFTTYLQNCSEYFKKFPKQITSCSTERALTFTETDPKLPAGWKFKTYYRNTGKSTGRQDKEFLSPELKVFRSRIAVVEYMKAMGGYSNQEMFNVLPIKVKMEV